MATSTSPIYERDCGRWIIVGRQEILDSWLIDWYPALKNAHSFLEKILNAMDTNHDGRISYTGRRTLPSLRRHELDSVNCVLEFLRGSRNEY